MFPPVETPEAWDALRRDDDALRAGVAAICARHGLATEPVTRFAGGSVPVYAIGETRALKLFSPRDGAFARTEACALAAVEGRLPIPTPALVAADNVDGWHYVLMTRLRGRLLVDAWPTLCASDRDHIATQLGECLATLHTIDVAPLAELSVEWPAFIAEQRATASSRQRARGLDPRWLTQIDGFLDSVSLPVEGPRSLLHTELMREHLLVTQTDRGFTLSGLFDFEPAMVGAPEYDLASFGLFVSCGDGRFLRRTLRAYGKPEAALDGALQRRLLAYALLHRYSNLRWYLERLPPPESETSLDALATRWWSLVD